MSDKSDVTRLVAACRAIGPVSSFQAPSGYPDGLALCILDSIWSIGVRYSSVVAVLNSWRETVRAAGDVPEIRGSSGLMRDIETVGGAKEFAKNVANMQRTSTRNGILKAEAVYQAATALSEHRVETAAQLRERADDDSVRTAWREVPGQRSGISWHYVLVLSGVQDLKPDRMITRFVERAVGDGKRRTPDEVRALFVKTFDLLHRDESGLTLRALDHAVWNAERRR